MTADTWILDGETAVRADPSTISQLFPAAGRAVGRDPISADDPLGLRHGTADDAARARLVVALLDALAADDAARELDELYRYGDDAERRGVLRGLNAAVPAEAAIPADAAVPAGAADAAAADPVVDAGLRLVADALRSNDPRLVAAAMGTFSAAHLDQHAWRHGVLKALFMAIPIDVVADLDRRADGELARMAAGLIDERRAAGRAVGDDMIRLATRPQED